MQISTSRLFDRASSQMTNIQNDLAKSQSQIATQRQVLNPSDAPDQAAAISRLKSVITRQDNYTKALDTVQARLDSESTTLTSAGDILVRIKELTVQASNGTQGTVSRLAIATEMKGLRDQLVSLGNSTDPTGNYIFSGSRVKSPAFKTNTDGSVSYQGDQTKISIQVGEQRAISVNRPATTAFVPVVRNGVGVSFFDSLDSLITGVRAGDQSVMQRGLAEIDKLHNGILLAQAEAGTDMRVVQQQGAAIDDTKLSLKTALSKIEDLDMSTAITDMQKLMLSLEAAQSSFAKTSQMSLFKFLG